MGQALLALGWGWILMGHTACLRTTAGTVGAGDASKTCVMYVGLLSSGQLAWSGQPALPGEQLRMLKALLCHVAGRLFGFWQTFHQPLSLAERDAS